MAYSSLTEALQLEEALAWVDGSVGWAVTLCAGAGWFVGFINPEVAALVFNEKNVCLAGSGKATGIAKKIANGYEVTGNWNYATGANIATAFTANCLIEEDGSILKNADGSPIVKPFLFLKEEVTKNKTWKSVGMIATNSNSFEVNQLVVNTNRAFEIDKAAAVLNHPQYQYPFLQFAETTLAVNSSGMAMRFLDLCKVLFEQHATTHQKLILNNAETALEDARQLFFNTVETSYKKCIDGLDILPEELQQVSNVSKQLAITARKLVDELYPYCGMQAANPDTEMNRVWRNLHTASQHSLFNR
ncbi:MAG: acyl-CoA dehydrogenase [Ferruginibacter sp.]